MVPTGKHESIQKLKGFRSSHIHEEGIIRIYLPQWNGIRI